MTREQRGRARGSHGRALAGTGGPMVGGLGQSEPARSGCSGKAGKVRRVTDRVRVVWATEWGKQRDPALRMCPPAWNWQFYSAASSLLFSLRRFPCEGPLVLPVRHFLLHRIFVRLDSTGQRFVLDAGDDDDAEEKLRRSRLRLCPSQARPSISVVA
jgi:hypothetical protein